jgi:glycosyltransferase involved in cell wall biosynthesis
MSKLILSHPTGNEFVRALIQGLQERDALETFHTTLDTNWLAPFLEFAPERIKASTNRRNFSLPKNKLKTSSLKEIIRLSSNTLGLTSLARHESGWASIDAVYQDLDRAVAKYILTNNSQRPGKSQGSGNSQDSGNYQHSQSITGIYSYEDACAESFTAAKKTGLKCFYELPIAYWQTSKKLLEEESLRLPEWEPTLVGNRDSQKKLDRKTRELELADVVICPSRFVKNSLPKDLVVGKKCIIAEFGSPSISFHPKITNPDKSSKFRVLFAGSLSQRKGLADLFAAIKLLGRNDIELVVMGALLAPMNFYRSQLPDFTYEHPRPHQEVLQLMATCDVLVLPSIVEGRALVQQEAMGCGLPVITTANGGADDLIINGETGFLVEIRSPEKLAENISWLADNRQTAKEMGAKARQLASSLTWRRYADKILQAIL